MKNWTHFLRWRVLRRQSCKVGMGRGKERGKLHGPKKLHGEEIFFFAVSDVSDHFGILDFVTNFFSIHFSTVGLSFFREFSKTSFTALMSTQNLMYG